MQIREWYLFEPDNDRDEYYTVSPQTLNRIKKVIKDSGILDVNELEEPEYCVEDGTAEEIHFFLEGRERSFAVDNLFRTYKGISSASNAAKLIKTVRKINKLIGC